MNLSHTEKVTLAYQGRHYTGTFRVISGEVAVFHNQATKKAPIDSSPPALLATQLLFELVVREGRGAPDPQALPQG